MKREREKERKRVKKDREPMPNARARELDSRGDDDNLRHLRPPHPPRGHLHGTGDMPPRSPLSGSHSTPRHVLCRGAPQVICDLFNHRILRVATSTGRVRVVI